MNILILNGPNLNLLGQREPDIYGTKSYKDLLFYLKKEAKLNHQKIKIKQSNYEGYLISKIQKANKKYDYIILNAGGLTHTSVSLGDAIAGSSIPVIEVHLSDINCREEFRKTNYIRSYCIQSFYGKGFLSYQEALRYIASTKR